MEQGWIYVLVNSSIPGMVKVGRTVRAPTDRAAELSGVTGVATPFIVAYEQFFSDCYAAERYIHGDLEKRGWRVSTNREFFRGAPSEIIRVVLEAVDTLETSVASAARARDMQTASALLDAGDRAWSGLGDAPQDTGEAIRCYKLAMTRGSSLACERLGEVFLQLHAHQPDRVSRRRAMGPLKEGARRGNAYCYTGMAWLFASEGNLDNFEKAFRLFFESARSELGGTGPVSDRYAMACCRYIGLCMDAGIEPSHRAELRVASDAIIPHLLAELERARADADERKRAAAQLRWAYGALLAPPCTPPAKQSRTAARNWLTWSDAAPA